MTRPDYYMVDNAYVEIFDNPQSYQKYVSKNKKVRIVSVISSNGKIILTHVKREKEYYGN